MISVIYCTRESSPTHTEHIIKSSGLHKHIEVIEIINNGESLTKAYNRGLKQAKNNIVVFCHDDIIIETKQWGPKLIKLFEKNPSFGIIGVAGSKHMPESGKWWEKPKQMYGKVQHTYEGKSWLSSYSGDLGQDLEPVTIVDGVFFAIDKTRIKKEFNENVEGFHFYDVTFCFENFLSKVDVGVTTVIRINHKSIGVTNEQWEENRVKFAETFKDNLPVTLPRVLRKGEKLKVIIGCLSFANFTGSELYVLELAKQLIKLGCEVSVCSNIGAPMVNIANRFGIKMYDLKEPPGYKLGDGKWSLKTPHGDVLSQPNTLYKVSNVDFDIIHLNHKPVTEHLLRFYPDVPVVCSIHSEVIGLEEPVLAPQIKKYIAIRPEIKEHIETNFNIDSELVDVIYNPIDAERFRPKPSTAKRAKERILFVGTIDYLRKEMIQDLINRSEAENKELWIVGKKNDTYLDDMIRNRDDIKYFEPVSNVEKFIHECDETAGILLGRTTIEGWMCGKKGWIYDVDSTGKIKSKTLHEVPNDLEKFKNNVVGEKIMKLYTSLI